MAPSSRLLAAALLLLPLLWALGDAFVFPQGLPDGVYKIPIDDKGNALRGPIFLDGLDKNSATTGRRVRARAPPPLPRSRLACGRDRVDKGALEHVKELFENMCEKGRKFDPGTAVVITHQGVAAYMCAYSAWNPCWRKEYHEATSRLDAMCGAGVVGSAYVPDYLKSYGRDSVDAIGDICRTT